MVSGEINPVAVLADGGQVVCSVVVAAEDWKKSR